MSSNQKNIAKAKAIESANKKRWLKVNPNLDNESGIYILYRNETVGYVGQSLHVMSRLCQHLVGYQWIDLSLKKHGLYSEDNPNGYRVKEIHFPKSELDAREREYIQKAIESGWTLRNKTGGGQDVGKEKIADYKPAKGYRDGIAQGRKSLANELRDIAEKHLRIEIKPEKTNNKVSQKQFEKFKNLLQEGNH